ncbi:MAG TPA: NlpC/P60 family protein [Thermoleophilia bacterium]|nr:NlpC/P60 family protein [Thermoleophilia bacterium]
MLARHDTSPASVSGTSSLVLTAVALVLAATAGLACSPSPATAKPMKVLIAGKAPTNLRELNGEAARVRTQIRRLDVRLEMATERYNGARMRLDLLDAELTQSRLQLTRTQDDLQRQQDLLGRRIAEMYKMGEYGWLEMLLNAGGFSDPSTQVAFFRLIRDQDRLEQQRLEELSAAVVAIEATIADRREQALEVKAELDADRAVVEQQLAERQRMLDSLDGRIKSILARQARLEAAEAARLARLAGVDLDGISGTPAQIAAVRLAMKFLGVPYVWGGASPGGFDCSGLTMYVYARFAVQIPHLASVQARMGTPVPLDELQPADLVFFGSPVPGGIHHVGMYVGSGLFIHAPHTGDVVKISVLKGYGATAACRFPLVLP